MRNEQNRNLRKEPKMTQNKHMNNRANGQKFETE